jgi:putative nucleotidyltransferase with HDIG domain
MKPEIHSINSRERIYSLALAISGLAVLIFSFLGFSWKALQIDVLAKTVLFVGAVIFADQFPIHLFRGAKASLTNLPIYLGAVLLPIPFAILVAGCGLLIAEFGARKERALFPLDIAATTGQWMIITSISYQIIHTLPGLYLPSNEIGRILALALGVIAFMGLDLVFFAVASAYILKEPFTHTIKSTFQESFILEGTQYILAFLGTLAVLDSHWYLLFLVIPSVSTYMFFKNSKEIKEDTLRLLEDMADVVDLRDIYTGGHSKRVAELVEAILKKLDIRGQEAVVIVSAARLHDIGKIGIPDAILKKPAKLTPEEMLIMQSHSELGANLIAKYKSFSRGVDMIRHHHEQWNGQGYPAGLKAHDIPFGARVIAVADSFDAMTSDRPYRHALSSEHALQILRDGMGKQWDANIVVAFVESILQETRQTSSTTPLLQPTDLSEAVP